MRSTTLSTLSVKYFKKIKHQNEFVWKIIGTVGSAAGAKKQAVEDGKRLVRHY